MTKTAYLFLHALMVFTLLLSLVPVNALAVSGDITDLMKDQLEPIEEVYDPRDDVTPSTFSKNVAQMINVVLGFLGIVFLILILYAGWMWMTSAGNEDKISKAKKTMVAAIIGVAIILAAYAISYFVINQLLIATKGEGL
ncbi:MAG: hypothetical protein HUU49_04875 [Candidatus Buchananbacteria bacterium]|nr:hypothetical protein [Candidatus Buchananbacteria bacterium]